MTKTYITFTDHQLRALIKLARLTGFEPTFQEVIRLMDDGTITINTTCRGRAFIWYFNAETDVEHALYIDTLEEMTRDELVHEFCIEVLNYD